MADRHGGLETSALWCEVVGSVASYYPDVALEYMLVDNVAMQLVRDAGQLDVLLTENTFGAPTLDLGGAATTVDFGDAVVSFLEAQAVRSG
jgi:isocitrate/isopropylmalate dehydrogenase